MKPIRLGLWGCGAMGEYHAQRFSRNPGVELALCWDRDEARAKALTAKAGFLRVAGSVDELIAGCDALSCALVDAEHTAAALKAADAGLPLFLEKPMAATPAEAAGVATRFAQLGLPLVVNFSKRNAPALTLARTWLAENRLGPLRHAHFSYLQSWLVDDRWGSWRTEPRWQWRTTAEASCHGVLGDLGSHLFDAAGYLFGAPVTLSSGMGTRTPVEGALGGAWEQARIEARIGDCPVVFEVGRRSPGHLDDLTISLEGTEGRLDLDLGARKDAVLWTPKSGEPRTVAAPPVVSTYDSFVDWVKGRPSTPLPPGGVEGEIVQRLIEEAHRLLVQEGTP